jgi:hypothetical protein
VAIGCGTTPWQYEPQTPRERPFRAKDTGYSLVYLFGGRRDLAELFEGGRLYQGFLSATRYHRWQAPLDGRIVRSWVEPGAYFAQRPGQGEGPGTWEGTESQPYLGHVAARAVFLFEHDRYGYVALFCVGMVEVSTCAVRPGSAVAENGAPVEVTRGTEIGRFGFGGSTHIMVFQKDRASLEQWDRDTVQHRNGPAPVPLGTVIATATRVWGTAARGNARHRSCWGTPVFLLTDRTASPPARIRRPEIEPGGGRPSPGRGRGSEGLVGVGEKLRQGGEGVLPAHGPVLPRPGRRTRSKGRAGQAGQCVDAPLHVGDVLAGRGSGSPRSGTVRTCRTPGESGVQVADRSPRSAGDGGEAARPDRCRPVRDRCPARGSRPGRPFG